MNRRDALKKMAATGVVVGGTSAILSSTAFADGGTAGSRPDNVGGTITFSATNINKQDKQVTANIGGLAPGVCGTDPAVKQYRWSDSRGTSTPWSETFQESFDVLGATSGFAPFVTLSVRWLCPVGTGWAWTCEGFTVEVIASPGGGSSGSVRLVPPAGTPVSGTSAAAFGCDEEPFPPSSP